ncbi:hypothetical protein [Mastigocoleus sp. MO_188.B34]|nr:hypothetical protein [Mastigocoleus sp. MO_188.B34]MDJ0693668.1 hypothetical protein [Mastigocoleus sp. MO_188.B34]
MTYGQVTLTGVRSQESEVKSQKSEVVGRDVACYVSTGVRS